MELKKPAKRKAHRPSRRHEVLAAAARLSSVRPLDVVTMSDIAAEADMTPAAVYYHFSSKDAIVLELVTTFGKELLEQVEALAEEPGQTVSGFVEEVTRWVADRREQASVYFVSSGGYSPEVEGVRRSLRARVVEVLAPLVRESGGSADDTEADVLATGVMVLAETSIISVLSEDEVYRSLGPRRFGREIASTADRMMDIV